MIEIEFYGIPRLRAGTARARVATTGCAVRLADVLRDLSVAYPELAAECFAADGRLRDGFTANLDGQRFVTDPETRLEPGDCLLIMSADAGG